MAMEPSRTSRLPSCGCSSLRIRRPEGLSRSWTDAAQAVEVGKPAEGAAAGVDDIEGPGGQRLRAAADVGGQELGRYSGGLGLALRQFDLPGADVDAGDRGAGVGPGERLFATAALEVAEAQAADVAGGFHLVLAQQRAAAGKEVRRRPYAVSFLGNGVPGVAVGGGVFVHGPSGCGGGKRRSIVTVLCAVAGRVDDGDSG